MKFLCHIKLGRIWFLVWFIGISLYLITRAIRRYIEFKTIQFEKVFEREIDDGVLNFYLTCIILAIVLCILCVYCTIFYTGNYANDCMQFGEGALDFKILKMKLQRELVNRHLVSSSTCFRPNFWKRMKCHFPPYDLTLYFSMSVTLLLSMPYLDSEKIKNGLGSSNSLRHTNLDMIFINSDQDTRIFNYNQDTFRQSMSFEFFNVSVSLLLLTFSYSRVFWKYNRTFTILFSIVICVTSVSFVLDASLVEMLVKVSRDPVDPKLHIFSPPAITILSLLSHVMLLVHQLALFEYAYIRISESLLARFPNGTSDSCPTTYHEGSNIPIQVISVCKQLCSESWSGVLRSFTVGVLAVLASLCFRIPYLYRGMAIVYAQSKDSIILANLVVAVSFLVLTLTLWIYLIVKSHWPIKSLDSSADSNGDCVQYVNRHQSGVPALPIYASVKRHPLSSPPLGQDHNYPVFCDPSNGQWRYSCSPPSCGPNDSNSDRTISCKNGDLSNCNGASSNKNYIMMMRSNQGPSIVDSPNTSHGIYSQLIKLTPQTSLVESNHMDNAATHTLLPNDISESSSNQTVHIISPVTLDFSRGTIDRASGNRHRMMNSSEYFNILNFTPHPIMAASDHGGASLTADGESTNLCSQV